jgi:hypothetical protein
MNKLTIENVNSAADKVKQCVLGKIEADIQSRLPSKPVALDGWQKYKLIISGKATIKKNIPMKDFFSKYNSDSPQLISCFNYPVSQEEKEYEKAKKDIQSEQNDRELAVELSFRRVVEERIFEMIDAKGFLDKLELLARQEW